MLGALIVFILAAVAGSAAAEDGWIAGKVYTGLMDPVSGATVTVVNGTQTATTNATGYFNMTVPEGNYTLKVTKTNHVDKTTSQLTVTANNTTSVTVLIDQVKGNVTGTVKDEAGAPVSYVSVKPVGYLFGAMTDSTGKYALTGLPVGPINLTVTAIGYDELNVSVTVVGNTNTTKDITLTSPVSYVTVTVQDSKGAGVMLATVKIGTETTISGLDGKASLAVAPGTYTMEVSAQGYKTVSKSVTISKGTINTITVPLTKTGTTVAEEATMLFGFGIAICLVVIILPIVLIVVVIVLLLRRKKANQAPPMQAPPMQGPPMVPPQAPPPGAPPAPPQS